LQGKGSTTRSIEIFSALSGHKIGELSFRNTDKIQYHALRIPRAQLLQGLLEALEKTSIKIEYGKKLVALTESEASVVATFEDGSSAKGDILLGCDGIHSIARMKLVDPMRAPVFSNTAAAYGMVPVSSISSPIHFEDTSVNTSRRGSLLTSFCDADRQTIYFAAVMEVKSELDHEGWKAQGSDRETTRKEVLSRFGGLKKPCLTEMVEGVEDLFFYPVYVLPPRGKWSSKRVMLLGDAAHAVCWVLFWICPRPILNDYPRCHPTEKALALLWKTRSYSPGSSMSTQTSPFQSCFPCTKTFVGVASITCIRRQNFAGMGFEIRDGLQRRCKNG
jgi:2-polyprenyl-6-methoxyphenol hydroxylase-like FAD-dependent oxidoreductase